MITAAALCPSPPLLCPPLTGRQTVLPELHAACAKAAERLMCDSPEMIVIIGPAAATGCWDAATRLNPSVFAPAITSRATGSPPLALGLGGMLLDQAQYRGRRRLQAVAHDEPASTCARLGAELAEASTRTALLVMGDGSARRGEKAPGYVDPRAAAFDAEVERAVRTGSMDALLRLDRELACDLMATGWPAWQVLASAMDSASPVGEVIYSAAPFGVAYLVAYLRCQRRIVPE